MAFPLTPAVNQRHTEAGVSYVWTTASWDVDLGGQSLVESTVDPVNGVDTADMHTVWRNTTSGSAWQYEGNAPTGPMTGAAVPIIDASAYQFVGTVTAGGFAPTWRQSFVLDNYATISAVWHAFIVSTVTTPINPGTITAHIYSGEDNANPPLTAIASLTGLGALIGSSDPITPTAVGATQGNLFNFQFNFPTPNLLVPGTYTVVFESNINSAHTVQFGPNRTLGNYGNNTGDLSDLSSFSIRGVEAPEAVWVPIVKDTTIQVSGAAPTTQPGGDALIAGDVWISSVAGEEGSLFYWDGAAWVGMKTFYENSIQSFLLANNQQEALDELDTYVDRLEAGTRFVGGYDVTSDSADFTTGSGFTDGALPVASTVPNTFVIATSQGTGTGNAPAIQINKGDFLLSDGTTWIVIPVGTAIASFTDFLFDTPNTYTGQAGRALYVNAAETGLEFSVQTDTHTMVAAAAPAARPTGVALTAGDGWQDSGTGREHFYDGAAWQDQVYTEMTAGVAPAQVYNGKLWYDTNTGTLYVYDTAATKFVAI